MALVNTAERSTTLVQRVDFNHPEYYKDTYPLFCMIDGKTVKMHGSQWKHLLVAITAKFISENNFAIRELREKPLRYENNKLGEIPFLTSRKMHKKSVWVVSGYSGGWINVDFCIPTLIEMIHTLCLRCGVDTSNVLIKCAMKNKSAHRHREPAIQNSERPKETKYLIIKRKKKMDGVFVTHILLNHFSNGYRLNSPIEMVRFRSFAAEDMGAELSLSDEELKTYIAASGTNYNGKVYAVSVETREQIKKLAEGYFIDGAQAIFFAEFYTKHGDWLFGASVISEEMLTDILRRLFPRLSFTQTYFGYTDASVSATLEREILRVWGKDILLTYDQIAERLQYVPLERIKYALGQNSDFIWSSVETFAHVSRIGITDAEREAVRTATVRECNARGYVSLADLPFEDIKERNYELSITAVHNAVYQVCLSDKFDKKGKIITRKGDVFDALTIMKEYCRTIDKCTLDDLLNYEKELTGEIHRWIPMEAGNTILVRINKEHYVADKYVNFDSNLIDDAIRLVLREDYLPLKSFTTFGAFPDCGQTWNLFLLESFCRRFSRRFRFDTPSVNSRNAGAVILRSCAMDYTQVMTDAVAHADIPLTEANIGRFLYDSGYIGKSTTAQATEIIGKAKAIRERRD